MNTYWLPWFDSPVVSSVTMAKVTLADITWSLGFIAVSGHRLRVNPTLAVNRMAGNFPCLYSWATHLWTLLHRYHPERGYVKPIQIMTEGHQFEVKWSSRMGKAMADEENEHKMIFHDTHYFVVFYNWNFHIRNAIKSSSNVII